MLNIRLIRGKNSEVTFPKAHLPSFNVLLQRVLKIKKSCDWSDFEKGTYDATFQFCVLDLLHFQNINTGAKNLLHKCVYYSPVHLCFFHPAKALAFTQLSTDKHSTMQQF